MSYIDKSIDKDGEQIFLQTHTKAVVDDNGNTVDNLLNTAKSDILTKENIDKLDNTDGMAKIVIKANASFASQLTQTNTIYIIRNDFDLDGDEVTIPADCVLNFEGGSLNNGTVKLSSRALLDGNGSSMTDLYVVVKGTGCTIKDLNIKTITAKGSNISTEYAILSNTDDVSGLHIHNVNITNTVGGCIKIITDNSQSVVSNIIIEQCNLKFYLMGIELQNHTNNNRLIQKVDIKDNHFSLYDTENYQYGFAISLTGTGDHVDIYNNTFDTVRYGVEVVGFCNVKIDKNDFLYSQNLSNASPISIGYSDRVEHIDVTNNYFELGVVLQKFNNSVVLNNTISTTFDTAALFIADADAIIVSNNIVSSPFSEYVFTLQNVCTNCIVSDNLFISTSTSQGLKIGSSCTNNFIHDVSISLIDKRKCFTNNGDKTNRFSNIYQVKNSMMWYDENTILVNGAGHLNWARTWLINGTINFRIQGDFIIDGYQTASETYTFIFDGGKLVSTSSGNITGVDSGPTVIGTPIIDSSVTLSGTWRYVQQP